MIRTILWFVCYMITAMLAFINIGVYFESGFNSEFFETSIFVALLVITLTTFLTTIFTNPRIGFGVLLTICGICIFISEYIPSWEFGAYVAGIFASFAFIVGFFSSIVTVVIYIIIFIIAFKAGKALCSNS